jgi:epoxyqueuosine reductase QueG
MNETLLSFIEGIISTSPLNRLPEEFGGEKIFAAPLLGMARGDDPMFLNFKEVVHREHLTPAEMWVKSGLADEADLAGRVRVLSIVFPFHAGIREAAKAAKDMPPEIYCVARNLANGLKREVVTRIVAYFQEAGFKALAGMLSPAYEILAREAPRIGSTWSERHVAFAAGLGTFSLHEGLITEAGCNVRLASVLTDAPLEITPRRSDDPFANCLQHTTGKCGKCVNRCPGGALSLEGHDKIKCYLFGRVVDQAMNPRVGRFLKTHRRVIDGKEQITYPVGCALCQFGVPCMDRNPVRST